MANVRNFSKYVYLTKNVLTLETMNQNMVEMPLAVKSKVLLRFTEIKNELNNGIKKPFDEAVAVNLGDPQGVGYSPSTFLRQVLSLCLVPKLIDVVGFPKDVEERAELILSRCRNRDVGSMTDPQGMFLVRKHIADFFTERDNGVECDPNNIFLLNGGSSIRYFFNLFRYESSEKPFGIMIPVPTYPIYHAVLKLFSIKPIKIYLNEEENWSLNIDELKTSVTEARSYCNPIGIVIINPGNPTGQVLNRKNIEGIIKFCHDENIFIIADEVYQQNIYSDAGEFHSFKKVKYELGFPYSEVELISMYSASKGLTNECGLRGCCLEFDKIDEDVKKLFLAMINNSSFPNTIGQIAVDVSVKPPRIGEPSYDKFIGEKNAVLDSLTYKSKFITDKLNSIDGLKLNPVQGGFFAYVNISIPRKAVEEAERMRVDPSLIWCLQLLEEKGIAVVPGCSFLQKAQSYHFRICILPPVNVLEKVTDGIKEFHAAFLHKYR